MTVQFAEGAWISGETFTGVGVAMTDEAFDLVEPLLKSTWPGWRPGARYGVSVLPADARLALLKALGEASTKPSYRAEERQLLENLAEWMSTRLGEGQVVSVLGY